MTVVVHGKMGKVCAHRLDRWRVHIYLLVIVGSIPYCVLHSTEYLLLLGTITTTRYGVRNPSGSFPSAAQHPLASLCNHGLRPRFRAAQVKPRDWRMCVGASKGGGISCAEVTLTGGTVSLPRPRIQASEVS